MKEIQCDVAVIGAGTAGMTAYRTAKRAGKRTLMIESGPMAPCAHVLAACHPNC